MKLKSKILLHDHNHDGLDRRGFLEFQMRGAAAFIGLI